MPLPLPRQSIYGHSIRRLHIHGGLKLQTPPSWRYHPILMVLWYQVYFIQLDHKCSFSIPWRRTHSSSPIPSLLWSQNIWGQLLPMYQRQKVQDNCSPCQKTECQQSHGTHLDYSSPNWTRLPHREANATWIMVLGHPSWFHNYQPRTWLYEQETHPPVWSGPRYQTVPSNLA